MQHLPAAAPDEHWVWPESTLPGFPSHPTTLWRPRALGLSITWASAYTTRTPDDCTLYRCVSFRAGWPLRALASHLTLVMDNPSGTIFAAHDEPGSAWHGGLQPPLSLVNNDSAFLFLRRLPIRPVLPGLLINTLFYALPIFILLSIPGALRSHLHKRRNLCPNCAYNLRGLPPTSPCPECGRQE